MTADLVYEQNMKEDTKVVVETLKTEKVVTEEVVIVASLVCRLTDLFGSAHDLYRKLKHRSCAGSSDEETERKHPDRWHLTRRHSSSGHERSYYRHRRHVSWKDGKKDDVDDNDEQLMYTASIHVREEYDRGYRRHGESYARGDVTAQMQLQMHIIQLQQVQLSIHQEFFSSVYMSASSSHSHLYRLTHITRSIRSASIQVLAMQHDRMLPSAPDSKLPVPGAFPFPLPDGCKDDRPLKDCPPPSERGDHGNSSNSSSEPDEVKPSPKPVFPPHFAKLFCGYSRDLQCDPNLPVSHNFKRGGSLKCPCCCSYIPIRPSKVWEIVMGGGNKFDDFTQTLSRTFLVKNRFVIKSHRENGGFACLLCARFKPSDTVCREVTALMEHLWKDHTSEELGKDEDISER